MSHSHKPLSIAPAILVALLFLGACADNPVVVVTPQVVEAPPAVRIDDTPCPSLAVSTAEPVERRDGKDSPSGRVQDAGVRILRLQEAAFARMRTVLAEGRANRCGGVPG